MLRPFLNKLVQGTDLTREEAREAMRIVMDGEATPAQIASMITSLRMKGETIDEITGFAETMRLKANRLSVKGENLLDTCGTGGDGGVTFNVSTAAAIVAAAAGARVAKHGNRAVSGKSGSADVLEALGVSIHLNKSDSEMCLEKTGLCFMFAPLYHQAMKHAVGPRREVGFRSVFNLLGPLTNPAGADRQIIGVFDAGIAEKLAYVLREIGLKRCLVVAGEDGLDEMSICAPTRVVELKEGEISSYVITPEEMGLNRYPLAAVAGGDAHKNASVIRDILDGEDGAPCEIVLLNAGAGLYLTEQAESIREGIHLAAKAIDTGAAKDKLQQLIQVTGEVSYAS